MAIEQPDIGAMWGTVSRFDTVIEWLMIALLAFMPLSYGAVEAWSEFVVIALAGAMALCLSLKLLVRREARLTLSWAYVPIALFIGLVVIQLLPLPSAWVGAISPHTASLKNELLGDLPNASALLQSMSLTFYPLATQHDLRLVLVAAVVFVVVLNIYRRSDQIKRLLGAIAIIGGAIALLALAQDLLGNSMIYWVVPTPGAAHAGPFVNHSHFSQFMNLSIGAALGLMLARLHEEFAGQPLRLPGLIARLGEAELRPVWYLGGMIVLGAITIFISLSRGGMIALLIAGAFTALMIASKRSLKGRGWIMFCVALAAFVCVLYVGFDAVYERMATLQQLNEYKSRWQILSDLTVSVTRFPSVGTGLGTHEVVYPMFDRSTIPDLAAHAENEYAQVAEETGIAGLTIVLLFLGIVGWSYARCVRRIRIPIRSAAFGLGLGLLAILIQSLSDFGQHLPANACLTAVTCALLIRLRRMVRSSSSAKSDYGFITRLWPLRAVAAVAVVGVWAWALVGANAARSAEASWSDAVQVEAQIRNQQWLASNEAYAALLEPAVAATEAEPDNVKYRHWLNVYRWNAIRRVRDPRTGLVILTPETRDFSEQIVDNLNQARTLCPTFGATYCVAGQIEKFVLDEPIGADHIRTGYRLAPCDATACFAAGMLDVVEGKPEASVDKFQRSRKLDSGFATDIIDVYLLQAKRPDLAMAFAEDDIRCLFQVADRLQNGAEDCDLATTVREKAVAMLKADCERDDVPSWELAMMANSCFQDDNYDEAVKWYRRALISDYDQVGWRINLAQALVKIGQPEDAMREARICLRLSPKMGAAKKLIGDLSLSMRPAATGSEK